MLFLRNIHNKKKKTSDPEPGIPNICCSKTIIFIDIANEKCISVIKQLYLQNSHDKIECMSYLMYYK